MIRRFAKFITFIFLVVNTGNAWSQDVSATQFMANSPFIDPALAGSNQGLRAMIMYRNQCPGILSSFESYSASYDQDLQLLNSGFGVSYMTNKIGGDTVLMAMFGTQYKELILGYSIDYSLSSIATFNGGAHEITLSYQIKNDKQPKLKATIQAPTSTAWF